MFENKVYSQVSSEFVSPLFPENGESVELAVQIDSSIEVEESFCVTNFNGVQWRFPLARKQDSFYFYVVNGAYRPEKLRYYFVFRTSGRFYYYSKSGVTVYPPQMKNMFSITPSHDSPRWIPSAFCYQIFPDRFCNGDASNDVHDNDYCYHGNWVTAHGFDEIPESYDKAHCLDFFNGDLKGIEEKLDYLGSLGVSCLYINPIVQSSTVHRFDAEDFFHVDSKLGGDEALASLIAAAHEKGIRVVVDISINHTSVENPWFEKAVSDPDSDEAGFYYLSADGSYAKWAGVDTMPQLNFNSQKLRDLLYRSPDSAMQKYLRAPFFQDGWRLDVAPELGRHGSDQLCREIWRQVHDSLKAVRKDIYLVGEDWNDASEYLDNDMWDATMNYYGSGRPLRSWMGERDRFLTGGWGHSPQADNAYSAYDLAAALESSMNAADDLSRFFRMNLFDSHDTPRLHNHREIFCQSVYEGVVMALFMLPGMPNVYYGDEIGLDGQMGSVEASRYPMQWDESRWNEKTLSVHRLMGRLRRQEGDELAYASTFFVPLDEAALAIVRRTRKEAWCLVLNKGEKRTLSLDIPVLEGYRVVQQLYSENGKAAENATIEAEKGVSVLLKASKLLHK